LKIVMWDAKCCEDYFSLSGHNGMDLTAASFINSMAPSQRYMSQHGVLKEFFRHTVRSLSTACYSFLCTTSLRQALIFVVRPQHLCEMRNVKRKRIVFFQCITVKLWSQKMGPVILVALIAHHTPNLITRCSTLWINMGTLLFRDYCIHRYETKLRR